MLAGNPGVVATVPSVYMPGENLTTGSSVISSMPYATETVGDLSAVTTVAPNRWGTAFNNADAGYALLSNNAVNKYVMQFNTVYTLSTTPTSISGPSNGGVTPSTAYYTTNAGSSMSTSVINSWSFATDTVSATSTALQSYSSIGPFSNYTFSNNPSIYFGGGTPAGPAYYGGLVKFNTSTSTAAQVWADATATSRGNTSGAENGTTGAYLACGNMMPYNTFTTNILKITYATDTTYSTLSATMSTARATARVGVQAGVCSYYYGGTASGSSLAGVITSVSKLTYSTETTSVSSTATFGRGGRSAWST